MERNNKGQFVYTTGGGRYKVVQRNGKRIQKHRLIWEQHFGKIPEGMIIHHKDGNKMNNDIDNLQMVDVTEHNNIHKHPAWNKGLQGDIRMHNAAIKSWENRIKKYIPIYQETLRLKELGKTAIEIASIMGVCERQIHSRLKALKETH